MTGYLLDTNIALLAVSQPEILSPEVRAAIERGPAYLSVVVYWEVMIKSMKGTLDIRDPLLWFHNTTKWLALRPLSLRPEHITALYALQPIHHDPFDRALIAQASVEDLTLLTTDATIRRYASPTLRVIR